MCGSIRRISTAISTITPMIAMQLARTRWFRPMLLRDTVRLDSFQ